MLETQNRTIHYNIVRTKRKTIGISIDMTGKVKVSVPLYIAEKQIVEIVEKKTNWIIKKLGVVEEIKKNVVIRKLVNGEKLLYLGKEYELRIVEKDQSEVKVTFQNEAIIVYLPKGIKNDSKKQSIKKELIIWYKKSFSKLVKERIKDYSSRLNVTPCKVVIKEQKTRWGSCSAKGNINLNWRLVMAPISIIDYVIVHELCHMKVMNHSKSFWKEVELIIPDYIERRRWLKENGHLLMN
ncbi:MAG: SprT family zinc-dependent metalloprotease [Tissierellales bacterium]